MVRSLDTNEFAAFWNIYCAFGMPESPGVREGKEKLNTFQKIKQITGNRTQEWEARMA
jgi:hypothetical protein